MLINEQLTELQE
jgi:hypothetical protein